MNSSLKIVDVGQMSAADLAAALGGTLITFKPSAKDDWWVYSTSIGDVVLMLENRATGARGLVRNPTREEWRRAYSAPSNPYPWTDASRVELVDRMTDIDGVFPSP
jgi:hypothetical protein